MSNEELKSRLDELHQELEKASTLSLEEQDMFGSLMADMVQIAQDESQPEQHNETLREKLEHQASDFDVDHPRLAGVLRQLLDSLGKMGI